MLECHWSVELYDRLKAANVRQVDELTRTANGLEEIDWPRATALVRNKLTPLAPAAGS